MSRMVLSRRDRETFWRRMLRKQARSGLSIRSWCQRHSLSEAGFHWWRRELARRDAANPETTFLPVRVAADAEGNDAGQIEIVLTGGRRVRVSGRVDRPLLSDVLAVLEGPPC